MLARGAKTKKRAQKRGGEISMIFCFRLNTQEYILRFTRNSSPSVHAKKDSEEKCGDRGRAIDHTLKQIV